MTMASEHVRTVADSFPIIKNMFSNRSNSKHSSTRPLLQKKRRELKAAESKAAGLEQELQRMQVGWQLQPLIPFLVPLF